MKRGDIPEVHRLLMADFQANPAPIIDFIAAQERNPFKILIGTILSARTRDETTSEVLVKKLFPAVKNFDDLRRKTLKEVEQLIYPVGFYHQKARALKKLPDVLDEKFGGQIPDTVEALCELPGVGRKTANVVGSNAFGIPAIAVDTHVFRVSNRIGLAHASNVEKTEEQLQKAIPREDWTAAHHWLIYHGRQICDARKPKCEICPLSHLCEYRQASLKADVKPTSKTTKQNTAKQKD